MKYLLCLVCLFLALSSNASAQRATRVRDSLQAKLNRIEQLWMDREKTDGYERLQAANESLLRYMMQALKRNKYTLTSNISWPSQMKVASSPDKKLRIWSWDTWTGGTMRNFWSVAQYQTSSGIKTLFLNDTTEDYGGMWCDTLFQIMSKDSQVYYLPVMHGIYSTKDVAQQVEAWKIVGSRIDRTTSLFQAKKKVLNSIDLAYNYFTNMNNAQQIHLNGKSLYIPLVEGDSVTKQWLKYTFNGRRFTYRSIK